MPPPRSRIDNDVVSRFVLSVRESAIHAVTLFLDHVPDLTPHLAYLLPVVMARGVPAGSLYDPELQFFVHDAEDHAAYKRWVPPLVSRNYTRGVHFSTEIMLEQGATVMLPTTRKTRVGDICCRMLAKTTGKQVKQLISVILD